MRLLEWYHVDARSTISGTGTEDGIILHNEEHYGGARITLERDGYTHPQYSLLPCHIVAA